MQETRREFRDAVIEEYYTKEDGNVYWNWRFAQSSIWHKELTAYTELPWVEFKANP